MEEPNCNVHTWLDSDRGGDTEQMFTAAGSLRGSPRLMFSCRLRAELEPEQMEEMNRNVHTWLEESEHSGANSDDGLSSPPSAAGAHQNCKRCATQRRRSRAPQPVSCSVDDDQRTLCQCSIACTAVLRPESRLKLRRYCQRAHNVALHTQACQQRRPALRRARTGSRRRS